MCGGNRKHGYFNYRMITESIDLAGDYFKEESG